MRAVVYNFSHPLSTEHLDQINNILNQNFQTSVEVREKRFSFHIDLEQNVPNQVLRIVKNAMGGCKTKVSILPNVGARKLVASPDGEVVLLRPPAMTEATYLVVLWYISEYQVMPLVPAFKQLRGDIGVPKFVVYDVIDLGKIFPSLALDGSSPAERNA